MRECNTLQETRGKVELFGNESTRHSPRCIDHGKPSRCGHGQTQKSGAISDWATNRQDALSMGVRSDRIMAYTDSDWAANREDGRSVSGGMLVHNGGLLRFWSRRQKAVSLSSWESELYAAVSTGVEALGLQSGLKDFGNNTRVTIACDNQGVVDHTARQGLGLAKHVHTRHLWLQAARDEGRLDVVKIPTERNPADLLTKPLPFSRIEELCRLVGVEYDHGT